MDLSWPSLRWLASRRLPQRAIRRGPTSSLRAGSEMRRHRSWAGTPTLRLTRYSTNAAETGASGLPRVDQAWWHSGEFRRWLWDAPADTAVAGVRLWASSDGLDELDGVFTAGDAFVDPSYSSGVPVENLTLNTTRLSIAVTCARGEGCYSNGPPPFAYIVVRRLETVLRDLVAPQVDGTPHGTLLRDGPLSGTVDVALAYRDRGGGLRSAALLVDGASHEERRMDNASCAAQSTAPVPCPCRGVWSSARHGITAGWSSSSRVGAS